MSEQETKLAELVEKWRKQADYEEYARLLEDRYGALSECADELAAALSSAAAPTPEERETPDFVALLKQAQERVQTSVLYRRFIDGTPLENDIAVWMANFVMDVWRDGKIVKRSAKGGGR